MRVIVQYDLRLERGDFWHISIKRMHCHSDAELHMNTYLILQLWLRLRWWCWRNLLPPVRTIFNVRIITLWFVAVVPVITLRRRRCHLLRSGLCVLLLDVHRGLSRRHYYWRIIRIGTGIRRSIIWRSVIRVRIRHSEIQPNPNVSTSPMSVTAICKCSSTDRNPNKQHETTQKIKFFHDSFLTINILLIHIIV